MTKLRIDHDGCIRGLWTDDVCLAGLGAMRVRRASHVEFDSQRQCWCVREAQPGNVLLRWMQPLFGLPLGRVLYFATTRKAALAWEHEHFQPGGPGWRDLT